MFSKLVCLCAFGFTIVCTSAFADAGGSYSKGIQCSDGISNYLAPLATKPGYEGTFGRLQFDLVPGVTVLVQADQSSPADPVRLNIVVASTEIKSGPSESISVWEPFSSAVAHDSIDFNLNRDTINRPTYYFDDLPKKGLLESDDSYKAKVIAYIQNNELKQTRDAISTKYGDMVRLRCQKQ